MRRLTAALILLMGGCAVAQGAEAVPVPVPVPRPVPIVGPASVAPAEVVPLKELPPDVCLLLRLADGTRRSARWTVSPFAALFATAWGKGVAEQVRTQPGPFQLLAQLAPAQQVTLGMTSNRGQPVGHVLAHLRDPAIATAMVATLTARPATAVMDGLEVRATLPLFAARLEGLFKPRAPGLNNGLYWSWDDLLPLPATVLAAPINPLSDIDMQWQTAAPWAVAGGSVTGGSVTSGSVTSGSATAAPAAVASLAVHAEWQVTPYGVHELVHLSGVPTPPSIGGAAGAVERTVFAGLPADTVWAISSAPLPALIEQIPGLTSDQLNAWMKRQDLPSWTSVKPQLGSALIWMQQGVPLPALTIDIRMPQETATAALAWLDAKHQFSPGSDGVHLGALGFIPLQAAWQQGSLVITTSSGGIAGAIARPGGFAAVPVIAEALKALPSGDLLLAGVSRSGESWASLAAVAPWLTRRKPELATLANDLRQAGSFGFISLRRDHEQLEIDAGGLFGGPLSTTAILGGFFRAATGDRGGERPARAERQRQEPRPEAPPLVEPPKQVEF